MVDRAMSCDLIALRVHVVSLFLFFLMTGCQSGLLAGDSKLAGAWAIVGGTEVHTLVQPNETRIESDIQFDPDHQKLVAIIRADGSFDLGHSIFGASGSGIAGLRKAGDRFRPRGGAKTDQGYYVVEQSRYTPISSFMVMSLHRSGGPTETLSLSATLLTSGRVAYEETFGNTAHKSVMKGELERFAGKLPWEDEGSGFNPEADPRVAGPRGDSQQ